MADIRIHKRFSEYTLNTDNPGRQQYWLNVMQQLEEQPFAALKIGVEMPSMGAAYYTVQHGICQICLSRGAASVDGKTVTFESDSAFAVFMHEIGHFQHMTVECGVFRSPTLFQRGAVMDEDRAFKLMDSLHSDNERLKSLELRNMEYEAGWRALYNDRKYKTFPGSRKLMEMMISNLFLYDLTRQTEEWRTKLNETLNDDQSSDKVFDWFNDKSLPLYKKYSEWEDPYHVIKGCL